MFWSHPALWRLAAWDPHLGTETRLFWKQHIINIEKKLNLKSDAKHFICLQKIILMMPVINAAHHLIFRSSTDSVKTDLQNHIILHCIYLSILKQNSFLVAWGISVDSSH